MFATKIELSIYWTKSYAIPRFLLAPITVTSYPSDCTSSLNSSIISPFLKIKFTLSETDPSKNTSALLLPFSTSVFFGNPASIDVVFISLLSAKYSNAHSKTSTPGLSKSQDSIRSCAMLTSFKLKSLILSPTSTIVAVALNDWEIFIPALNVGAENSLLLTAINTFMIRGASKMLKTKIAK